MAMPGVYTKEEEKMLAEWRELAIAQSGWLGDEPNEMWAYPVANRVASRELMVFAARLIDYWNPLWRDQNYARNTRWGGIIAPPMYLERLKAGTGAGLALPTSLGPARHFYLGEDWEFFQPVRVNDVFRVWRNRSQLVDVTGPDAKEHHFRIVIQDLDFINQRDELVNKFKLQLEVFALSEAAEEAVERCQSPSRQEGG